MASEELKRQLRVTDDLKCPECGTDLVRETDGIAGRLSKLGYFKMDARLRCEECGFSSAHDIPSEEDEEKSLEIKFIEVDEERGKEIIDKTEPPACSYHKVEMTPAHVYREDHLKFKCPKCFKIETKEVKT